MAGDGSEREHRLEPYVDNAAGAGEGPAEVNGVRPHILMIVMDACRPDHLSCYGYARPTTPRIDELVNEGAAVFDNAFSCSSWTAPAIASLFTGQFPTVQFFEQ